jgi:hypothetical protein
MSTTPTQQAVCGRRLGLAAPQPRNPWVAPSLLRKAGKHQPAHARQAAQRLIRRELHTLAPPEPRS